MSLRERRIGIRGQFLFLLVAAVLGVASVTATIAANSQRDSLLQERKLRGKAVLRVWGSLCRERLLSDESVNLAMWDFIDELMHGENAVVEVYLLDTNGVYLMHNKPSQVGAVLALTDSVLLGDPGDSGLVEGGKGPQARLRFQRPIEMNGRRLGLAGVDFSLSGIEEGIQESVRRIFLFTGLLAAVVVSLAYLLVYQVTRPIHLLVEGVRKFGETFDPELPESADVKIDFHAYNEIADVRDSFNQMTMALRTSMADRRALKEESGHLRLQATTDSLTGLFNKRQFEEDFPGLVDLARRRGRPLCLMMLDMDRFKILNDTQGHAEGDQALRDLAQAIRDRTRGSERAYRLGGDEFVVASLGTSLEEARAIAGRITAEYNRRKAPVNLTGISWGIVAFDGKCTPEEFLKSADTEMYRAKREKKAER